MRLIIGLGNPGDAYINNRHNVGHMVIQKLKKSKNAKLKDLVAKNTDCYMNESGEFVKKLVEQYRINSSDLWVIHDDLDIPLGSYKIQKGKGPKLHNGVNSIEENLGTEDFWRVRIGIENRQRGVGEPSYAKASEGKEYVLQDFSDEELGILKPVIDEICKKLVIY